MPRAAPVISADLPSSRPAHSALPSAAKRCSLEGSGVRKTVSPCLTAISPSVRTLSVPRPSAWTCRKVSEPRCSATPTLPCHSPALVEMPRCSGRMPMVAAPRFAASAPLDQVHLRGADEAGDEEVARLAVELHRRADLLDPAGVEHDDLVGHGHRLDLVVGDVDHRRAELVVQLADLQPHRAAQRGIEVGQRLVEQEGGRLAHDGAADGDALALAAGELAGPAVEIVGEVEDAGRLGHLPVDDRLVLARHLQREGDVVAHRHVRVERVGLEHHGELALGRRLAGHVARRRW